MKQYYLELYFRNDGKILFDETPKLDEYSNETITEVISSEDWNSVKKTVLQKHPETSFIQVHDVKDVSI